MELNNQSHGKSVNSGIICDVTNCVYNNNQKQCTAKQVKVGPQFASSSADTVCDTFRP